MGRRPEQKFLQRGHADGQQEQEKMFNISSYQRHANQNYSEISPHTGQNGYLKKSTNKKCQRECGEKGALLTLGGNVNWHYGEQYRSSLEK